uniref:Methyltransferase type 11 domain-containing protein n=1 Tax=viral metagenome TaxID=1070528 RepID=A0A6C0HJ24_9ZZZZ
MSKSEVMSFFDNFFKTLNTIIYPKTPNKIWLRLLLALALILLIVITYNNNNPPARQEGFEQNDHFVLKQGQDIYDKFYTEKYDLLMKPHERALFEVNSVIEMTEPTHNSVFLDVGSGTGHLVNVLQHKGYRVYGIDKSSDMIEKSEKTFPDNETIVGDVLNPMAFEHNTFSHILCMGNTIYELSDKETFFKNCYYWLVPNGYLILHLIDKDKFNPIIPVAKNTMFRNPQTYMKNRITNSDIDFSNFSYSADYIFPKDDTKVIVKEKFTDNIGNIRQNENVLDVNPIENILQIAIRRGFIVHAKVNMSKCNGDENQYLYILERAM